MPAFLYKIIPPCLRTLRYVQNKIKKLASVYKTSIASFQIRLSNCLTTLVIVDLRVIFIVLAVLTQAFNIPFKCGESIVKQDYVRTSQKDKQEIHLYPFKKNLHTSHSWTQALSRNERSWDIVPFWAQD